jgi:hypothetical protein
MTDFDNVNNEILDSNEQTSFNNNPFSTKLQYGLVLGLLCVSFFVLVFILLMNYNIIHWEYLQNILQQKSFFLLSLIIDLGLFISAIVGLFVVYKNDKELDATIFSNETETMSINIFNLIQQLNSFSEKKNYNQMLQVDSSVLGGVATSFNQILMDIVHFIKHIKSESNDIFLKSKKSNNLLSELNTSIFNTINQNESLELGFNKINLVLNKEQKAISDMLKEIENIQSTRSVQTPNQHIIDNQVLIELQKNINYHGQVFLKTKEIVKKINQILQNDNITKYKNNITQISVVLDKMCDNALLVQKQNENNIKILKNDLNNQEKNNDNQFDNSMNNLVKGISLINNTIENKEQFLKQILAKNNMVKKELDTSSQVIKQLENIILNLEEHSNALTHYSNEINVE